MLDFFNCFFWDHKKGKHAAWPVLIRFASLGESSLASGPGQRNIGLKTPRSIVLVGINQMNGCSSYSRRVLQSGITIDMNIKLT